MSRQNLVKSATVDPFNVYRVALVAGSSAFFLVAALRALAAFMKMPRLLRKRLLVGALRAPLGRHLALVAALVVMLGILLAVLLRL